MSLEQVRRARMVSLLLSPPGVRPDGTTAGSVADVVEWFGAMQAQDVASGHWSLGVRLPGSTERDVLAALERREALRTWPMRGTVHLVPARDAAWMVRLIGSRALAGAAKRRENLGIAEHTVDAATQALAEALAGGGRLTRSQCVEVIAAAGIETPGQVGYHLLWYASQVGITCIAPHVDGEQTFVLLDEWVPDPVMPEPDEALAILATRFFRSHGPATIKDLARWAGITLRESRRGVELAGDALEEVPTEAGPMVAGAGLLDHGPVRHAVLPGFDEYMLGYGDRTALLDPQHFADVVPGGNGVFQSTLVRDGRTVGVWKRTLRTKSVAVTARALVKLTVADRRAFDAALQRYAGFVGKPSATVTWV